MHFSAHLALPHAAQRLAPGLALSILVAAVAWALAVFETASLGQAWIGSLVLALIIGSALHVAVGLPERLRPGVDFSAKKLLELAIVFLGATMDIAAMGELELALLAGVAVFVVAAMAMGYSIGRAMDLSPRMSALIACGNAICGNSAILAAGPVLRAHKDEMASALAFTAALGIGTVLVLPFIRLAFGMDDTGYGILAGLTVYAVPQVLAAAAAGGMTAVQIGALVKLMRVLMLGPVLIVLGLLSGGDTSGAERRRLVPNFIIGFVVFALLRAFGVFPDAWIPVMAAASEWLSLIAMAALGLSVNLRTIGQAGGRVIVAEILSVVALALMAGTLLVGLDLAGVIG